MSMHNIPLTAQEEEGLRLHGLPIGKPSQLADSFRLGMKYALSTAKTYDHGPNAEEFAWEAPSGCGLIRFVSDRRYRLFSPTIQAFYSPYKPDVSQAD